MEIADFEPHRFSYEVRYPPAYALWDKAGAMTQELQRQFPTLEVVEGTPAKITLIVKPNIELVVELGKAFTVMHGPTRSGEDLVISAKAITSCAIDVLGVSNFDRVGTRLIYRKEFPTIEQAAARLISFKMLNVPETRVFSQQGALKDTEYRYRWESEATGVMLRFAAVTEKVDFNPQLSLADRVAPVSSTRHLLIADIDYFTVTTVLKEQLKVDDWIKNAIHLTNRDTKVFLKER